MKGGGGGGGVGGRKGGEGGREGRVGGKEGGRTGGRKGGEGEGFAWKGEKDRYIAPFPGEVHVAVLCQNMVGWGRCEKGETE